MNVVLFYSSVYDASTGRNTTYKQSSHRVTPTSGLVELQSDVSIEAEAEVVVEHIQRQLRTQGDILT